MWNLLINTRRNRKYIISLRIHFQNKLLFIALKLEYDISNSPISFPLPLHRLVALECHIITYNKNVREKTLRYSIKFDLVIRKLI